MNQLISDFCNWIKGLRPSWLIILFGLILYGTHFLERDPSDPYLRPIIGDAKGYYAYLPALIIYDDLQFEFMSEMDQKYYAVGHDKHIFIDVNDRKVNKTFPGVAILYLPFFLIAHMLALLFGLTADGYSDIYQYLFDFGQFFYGTLGLILAFNILKYLKFSNSVSLASILLITLASNLYYYISYDQSLTHIYNFFLINLGVWLMTKSQQDERDYKCIIGAVLVFCILLIVRPTGVLSLLLLGVVFPRREFWLGIYKKIRSWKLWLGIMLVSLVVFSIPLLLWKAQSGSWIIYSYGEEGFDFAHPQIINFLFSYGKGWFLYSPAILISIALGLFQFLKKREWVRLIFSITFLAISIYVFSSWWCWYYGFSFGQRPMVDFYLLIIIMTASFLGAIRTKLQKKILVVVGAILMFFNFLQSYQNYHGFYNVPTPTKEMYWDNFLNFIRKSVVYEKNHWNKIGELHFDFETSNTLVSGAIFEEDGNHFIAVGQDGAFSASLSFDHNIMPIDCDNIVVSFDAAAQNHYKEVRLVVDTKGIKDEYRAYYINHYLSTWNNRRIEILVPVNVESSIYTMYFWNADTDEAIKFDNISIEFYQD